VNPTINNLSSDILPGPQCGISFFFFQERKVKSKRIIGSDGQPIDFIFYFINRFLRPRLDTCYGAQDIE